VPSAVGLVDVSLLHEEILSGQGQMCNRMCNAGLHKCNRITAEEWQSG
jgi:hypothetical protein